MKRIVLPALVLLGTWALAGGEDFNQWRGPQRNGLTAGGPALDIQWAKTGPTRLWESEEIPGALGDGSGCVSVAGGKAYVYAQWQYKVDLTTRTLTELDRGRKTLPPELVAKLETIKNKEFPDPAALDAWIATNGVPDELKGAVLKLFPVVLHKSYDTLFCLNAADGKTLFKKQFEGAGPYGSYPYGASSTPTIIGNRCYFCGSKNDIYCLDATTGETIWQANQTVKGRMINHSSPLVTNGMVIVAAGPLTALDPATGAVIWTQPKVSSRENSPVAWKSGERTFLLCNTPHNAATVHCVDSKDGAIVWSVPGGGRNSVTVVGDVMITADIIGRFLGDPTKYGLIAYKLSADKAEKMWSTDQYSGGDESPVIFQDHVYSFAPGVAACLELATGKVCWEQKTTHHGVRSPVLADGKIFTSDGSAILVIRATPEKYDLLGKAKLPICQYSSPVVCNGRLYLRQLKNVACYDLTHPSATPAAK